MDHVKAAGVGVNALGAYGITYRWHRKASAVLEEVSFELRRGEVMALLGPNGSGKSTLMKAIAGIWSLRGPGSAGQVLFQGQDFLSWAPAEKARRIAYVGADLRAEFPLRAREAVMLGRICQGSGLLAQASAADREAVEWAMKECFCWVWRDRWLSSLSGGERQLVALARALVQGAKVLFLDEALSRMDLDFQARIGALLRSLAARGWSVLLVSHDVNLASEWADSCLLLKQGRRVATGPLREILTEANIQLLYPGAEFHVGANPATGAPKVFFGRKTR